jgi:hypothetical protein
MGCPSWQIKIITLLADEISGQNGLLVDLKWWMLLSRDQAVIFQSG